MVVNEKYLVQTSQILRSYGKKQCEGFVIWLGGISVEGDKYVQEVYTPPQTSIQSDDGVGYFLNSETLLVLNKYLYSSGMRLLAQVHSHPNRAYHSSTDDRYAIVTEDLGYSIVVPDFAFGPVDLLKWAVYQLRNQIWKKLSILEVKETFKIEGDSNIDGIGGSRRISILI